MPILRLYQQIWKMIMKNLIQFQCIHIEIFQFLSQYSTLHIDNKETETEIFYHQKNLYHKILNLRLLDTLLKIASGHTAFSLTLGLTQNFHQFFDQFEHSVYLLEQRLQNILQVADKNRTELKQFLNWLLALICDEASDKCDEASPDESKFDLKQLSQFLDEVVQHSGLNDSDSGRFILDRVFPHLFVYNCQQKIQQPTIEQQMQLCFQHFKIFFKDGLTKFFNMPKSCNILFEDKEELADEEESYNSDE
uniref:Uncharacterized protein n=1 Tax=Meloidogyne enterolobii TaxID=390850 RepID=A0A6V7XI02_MELEN|nr:unnamed protein product [Meloidogyne enterolobii]